LVATPPQKSPAPHDAADATPNAAAVNSVSATDDLTIALNRRRRSMVVVHEDRSKTVTARRGTVEFTISNFNGHDDFDRA
jgi:hypothetical protein